MAAKPVSDQTLIREARAFLKEQHAISGPLAPIITAAIQALLPLLLRWLTERFDVIPKS